MRFYHSSILLSQSTLQKSKLLSVLVGPFVRTCAVLDRTMLRSILVQFQVILTWRSSHSIIHDAAAAAP